MWLGALLVQCEYLNHTPLGGREIYAPQTEILEDRTNISEHVSLEALFKGVGTRFWLQNVEKCFPGKRVLKCLFGLPKLPLPNEDFGMRNKR
jgi:hypothetical protein